IEEVATLIARVRLEEGKTEFWRRRFLGECLKPLLQWSGIDRFKEKFTDLEEQERKEGKISPLQRHYTSLPRELMSPNAAFYVVSSFDHIVIQNREIKIMVDLSQIAHERHPLMILQLIPVEIASGLKTNVRKLFLDQNVSNFSMKPVKDLPLLADLTEKPFVLYLEHIAGIISVLTK
ncbi:hypothetical protein Tco_0880196, partial [Tanacetum coccineum]